MNSKKPILVVGNQKSKELIGDNIALSVGGVVTLENGLMIKTSDYIPDDKIYIVQDTNPCGEISLGPMQTSNLHDIMFGYDKRPENILMRANKCVKAENSMESTEN